MQLEFTHKCMHTQDQFAGVSTECVKGGSLCRELAPRTVQWGASSTGRPRQLILNLRSANRLRTSPTHLRPANRLQQNASPKPSLRQ